MNKLAIEALGALCLALIVVMFSPDELWQEPSATPGSRYETAPLGEQGPLWRQCPCGASTAFGDTCPGCQEVKR